MDSLFDDVSGDGHIIPNEVRAHLHHIIAHDAISFREGQDLVDVASHSEARAERLRYLLRIQFI